MLDSQVVLVTDRPLPSEAYLRYKYRLYFTGTSLVCTNSTVFCGSASNWGVTYFGNPLIIQHGTPIKIDQVVHSSETIMLDAWRSPKTNLFLCNIVMAFSILLKIAPGRVVGWPYALCMVMPSTNIRKLWGHHYDRVGILGGCQAQGRLFLHLSHYHRTSGLVQTHKESVDTTVVLILNPCTATLNMFPTVRHSHQISESPTHPLKQWASQARHPLKFIPP